MKTPKSERSLTPLKRPQVTLPYKTMESSDLDSLWAGSRDLLAIGSAKRTA